MIGELEISISGWRLEPAMLIEVKWERAVWIFRIFPPRMNTQVDKNWARFAAG